MSNKWTHSICDDCWLRRENRKPELYRMRSDYRTLESCCVCGTSTKSGIFVREDPEQMACLGTQGVIHA